MTEKASLKEVFNSISGAVLIALIACVLDISPSHADTRDQKLKIGVSVPLTGPGAAYGTDIKNALVFANQRLAGSAYELVIEDDQCSNKEAVSVAHKLVDIDRVKYILGFGCSGTVLAAAPVYEKAKVVVIASGTGAPAITSAGDYIFRTKPNLNFAADVIVKDLAKRFKKVGIITEETDYCQGLTKAISDSAAKLNLNVINQNFLPGSEDFRTTLIKLKASGAEALFLNPQGEAAMVNLYRQFLEIGWKAPVYGTFMPGGSIFISAFGARADGIVYADVQFNSQMLNAHGLELYAEFEREYGKPKGTEHFGALTFVAFSALDQAIKSKKEVKSYLYNNKFQDLVAGGHSFDSNGDIVSDRISYVLKTLKNGVPSAYE